MGYNADLQAQKSRMREISSRLEKVTKRLGPAIADLNGEQKTVTRVKDLVDQIQTFESADGSGGDSDKALADLLAVTNDFVLNYVANFSNLILDPDLDSYYLMDAYTGRLGSLTETLVNIGHSVITRTEAGSLNEADRLVLAAYVARARSFASDLKTNFDTAFANNAAGKLRPAIGATVDTALADVNTFLTMIDAQALGKDKATMTPGEFCNRTTATIDSVQKLHDEVGPQLDGLIVARVDRYSTAQMTGLATGFLAVGLIIYVLLSFYFQVSTELTGKIKEAENLRAQAETENQLLNGNIMDLLTFVANCADGDLTGRAKVTEGALGNVADAMNQMMDNWTEVLGTLIKTIEETQNAGLKVGETAESMAHGATEQAQKLDAATAAVQQIRGNITQVSENANTAVTARLAHPGVGVQRRRDGAEDRRGDGDAARERAGRCEEDQEPRRPQHGDHRHRRHDRQDLRADQHAGAQRRDRSGARRRTRPRLQRRRRGSPQARRTHVDGDAGHPHADHQHPGRDQRVGGGDRVSRPAPWSTTPSR